MEKNVEVSDRKTESRKTVRQIDYKEIFFPTFGLPTFGLITIYLQKFKILCSRIEHVNTKSKTGRP